MLPSANRKPNPPESARKAKEKAHRHTLFLLIAAAGTVVGGPIHDLLPPS